MMITLKELFKRFLLNYLSRNDNESEEIDRLTNEWLEWPDIEYFTSDAVKSYLDYLEHNLSDEYLSLYDFGFNESRFSDLLKNYNRSIEKINIFISSSIL